MILKIYLMGIAACLANNGATREKRNFLEALDIVHSMSPEVEV